MMKKSEELEEMKRKFEKTNYLLEDSKQELAQILSRCVCLCVNIQIRS